MQRFVAVSAIAWLLAQGGALAQENVGSTSSGLIVEGMVGIKNLDSSVSVHFSIEEAPDSWQSHSLAPGQAAAFRCDSSCGFAMQTEGQPLSRYRVEAKGRYGIYWNAEAGMWDLGIDRD